MFCTNCGCKNPDNARFCMKCGNKLPVLEEFVNSSPAMNCSASNTNSNDRVVKIVRHSSMYAWTKHGDIYLDGQVVGTVANNGEASFLIDTKNDHQVYVDVVYMGSHISNVVKIPAGTRNVQLELHLSPGFGAFKSVLQIGSFS